MICALCNLYVLVSCGVWCCTPQICTLCWFVRPPPPCKIATLLWRSHFGTNWNKGGNLNWNSRPILDQNFGANWNLEIGSMRIKFNFLSKSNWSYKKAKRDYIFRKKVSKYGGERAWCVWFGIGEGYQSLGKRGVASCEYFVVEQVVDTKGWATILVPPSPPAHAQLSQLRLPQKYPAYTHWNPKAIACTQNIQLTHNKLQKIIAAMLGIVVFCTFCNCFAWQWEIEEHPVYRDFSIF